MVNCVQDSSASLPLFAHVVSSLLATKLSPFGTHVSQQMCMRSHDSINLQVGLKVELSLSAEVSHMTNQHICCCINFGAWLGSFAKSL